MKTLTIINGATGAIGSACLAAYSRSPHTTIVGLSRRAPPVETFCRADGKLPDRHLLCSIGENIADRSICDLLAERIAANYERIVYVHAVGVYPFELDEQGAIHVSHDHDGDGIDDRVRHLTHDAFFAMTEALGRKEVPLNALIFGGLADRHRPAVHQSWWKVMEQVKARMRDLMAEQPTISCHVLNISSVMCPNELLVRPFVFTATDADPAYWLKPHEVADEVVRLTTSREESGFQETDLYHAAPYHRPDYYEPKPFTDRKRRELGRGI